MFYENFLSLCKARRVSPSRAALEAGLSRAAATNWKKNPDLTPSTATLDKLCDYFDVPISTLLEGSENMPAPSGMNFYDRFATLCRQRGVCPSRAAEEAGMSRSSVSKWKREPNVVPSGAALNKLSAYFGISASTLLQGDAPTIAADDTLKFALFGGREDITPEMYDEVRSFAQFVMLREDRKRRG